MSRVDVHVQIGQWPSSDDIRVCLDLDPIRREALAPLDFAVNSPGFMATPTHVVRRVMRTREGVAKELVAAIMQALGERDTHDGYPKEPTP